jgi:hypothetical protein
MVQTDLKISQSCREIIEWRPMKYMLRIGAPGRPADTRRELDPNEVASADQRAVADLSRKPRVVEAKRQFRVYRNRQVYLYARSGPRDVLQNRFGPVRPPQPVAPEKLDDIGAEISLMRTLFAHTILLSAESPTEFRSLVE